MMEIKQEFRQVVQEVQVVIRHHEYCERCGAKNPFRRQTERREVDGSRMWYAKCKSCGAPAKVFWTDE